MWRLSGAPGASPSADSMQMCGFTCHGGTKVAVSVASRSSSWMWLCYGLQVDVVPSGDQGNQWLVLTKLQRSQAVESVPVGVGGGSANEKPGKALLYVF